MTLYTSADFPEKKKYFTVILACLLSSVGFALFGAVYEFFSHEVYSYYMIYAFAFPLLLGVVPFVLMEHAGAPFPRRLAVEWILAGIASLTVGSVVLGVLEIYGTTNPLVGVYWIAGALLTAIGWLFTVTFDSKGGI